MLTCLILHVGDWNMLPYHTCRISSRIFNFDWFIKWCLRLIGNVSADYNGGDFYIQFEVLKFSWWPSRAFSSLKYRKTVFCEQRGLLYWHRTQVNVSSDGHIDILEISNLTKLLKNILKSKTFILCWKNRIRIYINCKKIETLISNNVYYVRIERIKIIHVFTWLLILSFFP